MPLMYKMGMIEIEGPRLGSSYLLTGEGFQDLLLWRPRIGEVFTICGSNKRYFRARVTGLGKDKAEILLFRRKVLLWEGGEKTHFKGVIRGGKDINDIAVMIGPEGGFEEAEVEEAKRNGFIPVGLGERVLRTETVEIIMVGLIQYELGGLG